MVWLHEVGGVFEGSFSAFLRHESRRGPGRSAPWGDTELLGGDSTAVKVVPRADPQQSKQIARFPNAVGSSMQASIAIEPLKSQRQGNDQPVDQNTVRVMMTDMFKSMPILGVTKTVVFNFPSACCHGGLGCQPLILRSRSASKLLRRFHPVCAAGSG